MRRTLFLLALALALGGCGTAETGSEPPLPPRAAEPQRAVLGWREFHPARVGERLRGHLGLNPEIAIVPPKSIPRSEGKAVRVVERR